MQSEGRRGAEGGQYWTGSGSGWGGASAWWLLHTACKPDWRYILHRHTHTHCLISVYVLSTRVVLACQCFSHTNCVCVCVRAVTTLRQRLLQPDFQPAGASQLHPKHKHLLMKRSLRCRVRIWHTHSLRHTVLHRSLNGLALFVRNVSTTWVNPSSTRPPSSLKSSWWLCEYSTTSPPHTEQSQVSLLSDNDCVCVCRSYIPEVRIMSIPNLRHMKASVPPAPGFTVPQIIFGLGSHWGNYLLTWQL